MHFTLILPLSLSLSLHAVCVGLKSKMSPHSAIEWALARSSLIDSLRNAIMGNYHHILSLASVLENGQSDKRLLDIVINRCKCVCVYFNFEPATN